MIIERKKDKIVLIVKDEIENLETFNNISKSYKENYFDHYSKSVKFLWKNEQEIKEDINNKQFSTKKFSISLSKI